EGSERVVVGVVGEARRLARDARPRRDRGVDRSWRRRDLLAWDEDREGAGRASRAHADLEPARASRERSRPEIQGNREQASRHGYVDALEERADWAAAAAGVVEHELEIEAAVGRKG